MIDYSEKLWESQCTAIADIYSDRRENKKFIDKSFKIIVFFGLVPSMAFVCFIVKKNCEIYYLLVKNINIYLFQSLPPILFIVENDLFIYYQYIA